MGGRHALESWVQDQIDNATDDLMPKAGGTFTGPVQTPSGSSADPGIRVGPDVGFYRASSTTFGISIGGAAFYQYVTTFFGPTLNTANDVNLGAGSRRWNDVYAVNGTIQTSDGDSKSNVRDTPLGKDFARRVRPVEFEFTDGRRPHQGFVAQEIKQLLDDLGVPDSAAYVDPAVAAQKRLDAGPPEDVDEDEWRAEVESELNAPKGLRYSELIPPLYRAFQQQQDEIDDLRARLEALESA